MENSIEVLLKTKNKAVILSINPTPGYVSRKDENTDLKRYTHPYVHSSAIYNNQDMEKT